VAPLALREVSAHASALDGLSALASRLNPLALADGALCEHAMSV
jgi:hypothetical protein